MKFFSNFGKYLLMLKGMLSKPENPKLYWKEYMHQCSEIGIGSLGIVMIISVFMGAVSAVQTAYQISNPLINKIIIAQIVRDTVILGINTKTYLILPKIAAAITTIPMLVIVSMFLGVYGGRLTASLSGVLSADTYDKGLMEQFIPYNVFFAMMKAYTFAFLLSSIPAYFGYYVNGGSLEIGRSSTKSVVITCIVILFADYILAALLL